MSSMIQQNNNYGRGCFIFSNFYRSIMEKKVKFIAYITIPICFVLLLTLTLGENYDGKSQRIRGAQRRPTRQVVDESPSPNKDPFSNRPRIQTRNGHLVIEASPDKNIDFKTSGSRGTITINGHKLDQLLDVTKALERSILSNGGKSVGLEQDGGGLFVDSSASSQFDLVLRKLLDSSDKLLKFDKKITALQDLVNQLSKQVTKLSSKLSKQNKVVKRLDKKQETIETKLKRNDCFNSETGQPNCKNGATCVDTYEGFKCLCTPQYEGQTCEDDVDECSKFRGTDLGCQNGAKCINFAGGFSCECPPQYHGIYCTEQHDDCSLSTSRSLCGHGKCINLARNVPNQARYECACDQGWTTDGINPVCVIDINECMVGQTTTTTTNSSTTSNLVSTTWSNSLMAAYPCSQNPFVECINLLGSFECGPCPPGYTGNGRVCRDTNECLTNNGGCSTSPLVECINTQGSHRCAFCPPGYTGDGATCSRMSPCDIDLNGGCHPMAKCVELNGVSMSTRFCICNYPLVGDGIGAAGCSQTNKLGPTNYDNNYDATRNGNDSTTTTTTSIITKQQDDCDPNPCLNDAECKRTDTGFSCICLYGWKGKLCDIMDSTCGGRYYLNEGGFTFPRNGSFTELIKNSFSQAGLGESSKSLDIAKISKHYDCLWSISVSPSSMSIQLKLSNVINLNNPRKKIQYWLANSTTGHKIQIPTCSEYLDIREVLDGNSQDQMVNKKKLLAKICIDGRGGNLAYFPNNKNRELVLFSESNTAEIEYSFSATRTQFGEPSLSFTFNWTKTNPACGGSLDVAEFGSISSPKFPEFYQPGTECRYLIHVPNDKRIRVQFGELNLLTGRQQQQQHSDSKSSSSSSSENCADSLTILDGSFGLDRPVLFKHCANNYTFIDKMQNPIPIISSSSTIELILNSQVDSTEPLMRPKQKRGFYLTYASESITPGCGGLYTAKSAIIKSTDYEADKSSVDLASSLDDQRQILQLSHYLENVDSLYSSTVFTPPLYRPSSSDPLSARANSSEKFNTSLKQAYKVRCEYEIRPANQGRNHKISLDWLEMPRRISTQNVGASLLTFKSRKMQCSRNRLIVYDGNPLDNSNRTELATFCGGDKYNASSPLLVPIISSGHSLILVYETTNDLFALDRNAQILTDAVESNYPTGFKLRYSTVCTSVYYQTSGNIQVEIDDEVSECIYHIMLPPNNTISLIIEQRMSEQTMADGSCPAQAIFMDGAIQGGKLALTGAEKQLKTYNFDQKIISNLDDITYVESRVGDTSSSSISANGGDSLTSLLDNTNSNSAGDTNSYWQYSNGGQSHDIKEFEVCSLSALSFDSVWNHLSLLFRLKQPTNNENKGSKIGKVNLVVRYQAEPSCGGIIDKPREGSFKLVSNQRISSINSFPLTANKYEQLHKQQFLNNCAWILKAPTNQQIQLKFDVPVAEIKKLYDEWLIWSKKQPKMKSNNSMTMKMASSLADSNSYLKSVNSFNCAQVYEEVFELYEPSINRTRYICPNDLNLVTQDNKELSIWSTQSNIVYVRVQNSSEVYPPPFKNSSTLVWPAKKKLNESLITLNYKFVSSSSRQCGGRLIQDSGVITSPMYPYNYPSNALCIWVIQANPSQQIRLNFSKFEIEKQGACLFDFLELRNGPTSDSPLIGRFCNQDLQSRIIISHSNFLWLKFKSDTSLSRPGFEIYFDGAQTGCGGRLSSASGQIDSPNYPLPYSHSSDCKWIIEVVESSRIELIIQDLELSNCRLNGTKTDYLEIFDSPLMSTNSLGRFCHKRELINTTIISSSNKLSLDFKSQALDNSRGFRITYKTYCNPIELTGFQGVIESPGYPTGYQAFSNCAWTIKAPLGSNLSIAITDLDLEETTISSTIKVQNNNSSLSYLRDKCRDDFVEIYSIYQLGQQNNSSIVKNYTALIESQKVVLESRESKKFKSKVPKNGKLTNILCGQISDIADNDRIMVLNSNLVHINFESDRSVEFRGFRIEWIAQGCGGLPEIKSDSHSSVSFHEQMIYQKRPTECLWVVDFSKSFGQIEISLDSDMRMPDLNKELVKDSCEDASFIIYDGLDDKSPILFKNCDSQYRREILTSSSFHVSIKFYTSGQHNYGRGFNLDAFLTRRTSCLTSDFDLKTPFNQVGLVKKSPKYPDLYDSSENSYNCFGLVSARRNSRIKLSIDELDIPIYSDNNDNSDLITTTTTTSGLIDPITCRKSGNYLLIKTSMSKNFEEIYCGKLDKSKDKDLARASIVMEEATVWEEFSAKGGSKGRWKISYARLCGSLIWIEGQRDFTTPNYPLRPNWPKSSNEDELDKSENVCIWNLKTRNGQGQGKLYLNIINFIESDNKRRSNVDCLRIYEGVELNLKRSQFNLTEIDSKFTPRLKICKLSDIKYSSLQYISRSSEVFIIISGDAIVKFQVKPFENGCGGEYRLRKSEFASLGYPEPYSELLDCHHFIKSTPGSKINLKFLAFDLPEGGENIEGDDKSKDTASRCDNVDYVEVRQLSISKKLNLKLNPISASYRLGVWSDSGFILEQMKKLKSNPQTTVAKVVNTTNQSLTPLKQRLFDIAQLYYLFDELHSSESSGIHLSLNKNSFFSLDNFYENSRLVGRYCGTKIPGLSNTQLFDEVLVRFRSHGNTSSLTNKRKLAPKGFLAEYEIQYGGLIQLTDKETMEEGSFISSPSYPAKIRYNNSIKWTFETKLDSILQFDLITLDLGSPHLDCIDSLNIYDGLNVKTSIRLSQTCGYFRFKSLQYFRKRFLGRWPPSNTEKDSVSLNINALPILEALNPKIKSNLIRSVRTSSNVATIIYDNFKSDGLFLLRYKAINKNLAKEQRNSSSYSGENYIIDEDEVMLEEKQDSLSNINIDNNSRNASKLCSNTYQLNMWHDKSSSGGKNNKSSTSQSANQVALFSPNYPQRPKQAIECHWLIYTPDDTIINLSIDPSSQNDSNDRLNGYDREHCSDFNRNTNLYQAYMVVHDGASRLSPIIGRFCLPAPPKQISSSGRHMLVRYIFNNLNQLSNADDSSSSSPNPNQPSSFLFKGRASVGQCGGQYHVSSVATISDRPPNSGTFYANNLNCRYYIFAASQDKVLTIYNSQSELELAKEPTNANCTVGDYIEIRDLPIQSEIMELLPQSSPGRSLGRFCAGRKLEVIESPGSAISIEFKTDNRNTAKGWELRIVSGDPYLSCPFGRNFIKFDEPFGRLTSPNWPHGLNKERHCQYGFEAPTNQSILVTFVRLNRPLLGENGETNTQDLLTKQNSNNNNNKCADSFDYLADDEASLLYRFNNLRDLNSPISGTLLRDYVQQIPCKSSSKFDRNYPSNSVMKLEATEQQETSNISPEDLASLLNIDKPGYKKISSDEYYKLIQQAPTIPFEIRTNSHVLLMDYQTNSLLPKQGFVAVYRTVDDRKFKCGGELTYQSSTSSSLQTSLRPSNYFESANFNQESQQNDEYIQCDWSLEAQPDKLSQFDRSLSFTTEYSMVPTANLGNISNNYIVFQTLEIPPTKTDKTVFNDNFMSPDIKEKSNELCGLNRLLIIDTWFSMPSLVACGNLTSSRKWYMLSYGDRKLSIRTKNLLYEQKENNNNNLSIYRGVKGFLYEKNCLQVERIIGDGIRLRSHREYPNSSYTPGICRWRLQLDGGNYELSFDKVQFRPPDNYMNKTGTITATCDTNNPDLDYIEIRATEYSDSPILARYCIYNQMNEKDKAVMLSMESYLVVTFVAGVKQLSAGLETFVNQTSDQPKQQEQIYGFDMEIIRISNGTINDFCRRDKRESIYWFIRSSVSYYYDTFIPSNLNFLYPKNVHCFVDILVEEGMKFNLTFRGVFDIEPSKDCKNDYIQIDDIITNQQATNSSSDASTEIASNKTHLMFKRRNEPIMKFIGKWCGRTKPNGYFLSTSNSIRITFHSNEQIEGKGFTLVYSGVNNNNSTNTNSSSRDDGIDGALSKMFSL